MRSKSAIIPVVVVAFFSNYKFSGKSSYVQYKPIHLFHDTQPNFRDLLFNTLRNWHGRSGKSLRMIECSQPFIFPNVYLMNSRIHASVEMER